MKKIFGVLMLCILLIGTSAQATRTWVSGNTGSWNTTANWSGGALPSTGETAQVNNGTCNVDATPTSAPGILLMGAASTDVGVINITADMQIYKSGSAGAIEMIKAGTSAGGSATINQSAGTLRVGAAGTANGGTTEARLVTASTTLGTATYNLSGGILDTDVLSKGNKTNTAATFNATGGTLELRTMVYRFGKISESAGFNQGTCTLEMGSINTVAAISVGNGTNATDYTVGTGGTMNFDIASASSFDKITQFGDIVHTAGATLSIDLLGGYIPLVGSTYDVWTFSAYTGQTNVSAGSGAFGVVPDGWTANWVDTNADTVNDTLRLTYTPEPATIALLSLGLIAIRRNKK